MCSLGTLIIVGQASRKTIVEIDLKENTCSLTLMELLHQHNIPIASSCLGEGVCKKCCVNNSLLSCQITIRDMLHHNKDPKNILINVSYL